MKDPFGFTNAINWDVVDNLTPAQLDAVNAAFEPKPEPFNVYRVTLGEDVLHTVVRGAKSGQEAVKKAYVDYLTAGDMLRYGYFSRTYATPEYVEVEVTPHKSKDVHTVRGQWSLIVGDPDDDDACRYCGEVLLDTDDYDRGYCLDCQEAGAAGTLPAKQPNTYAASLKAFYASPVEIICPAREGSGGESERCESCDGHRGWIEEGAHGQDGDDQG